MTVPKLFAKDSSLLSTHWLTTPFQNRGFPLGIIHKSRNFLLWLLLFNYLNYQMQTMSVQLSEVDVISLLSHPHFRNDTIPLKVENILHGIYLRNEQEYIDNINHSTIVTRPVVAWSSSDVKVRLSEHVFHENFTMNMLKSSQVDSSLVEMFSHSSFAVWTYKDSITKSQSFLKTVLDNLYGEINSNVLLVHHITENVFLTWIGVYSVFVGSIVSFLLYVVLLCFEKRLGFHYLNLIPLFVFQTANIGFVIMIIIARSRLRVRLLSDGHVLPILILELIMFVIYIGIFYYSHRSILYLHSIQQGTVTPSSSVYSDLNDAIELQPVSTQESKSAQPTRRVSIIEPPRRNSVLRSEPGLEQSRRCNTAPPVPLRLQTPKNAQTTQGKFTSIFRNKH